MLDCSMWSIRSILEGSCLRKSIDPTLVALKNTKFRLSRNSMKFDVVARFHETIPTMKSASSSEI